MGKSRYLIVKEVLEAHKEQGIEEINLDGIKKIILMIASSAPTRTIKEYTEMMLTTGLILDIGMQKFKIL